VTSMLFAMRLALLLGWQDVKQAYRRSAIGPFWITGGMAVQIGTMAVVFGLIFKADLHQYLPFLASSIVIWGLISSALSDGSLSFIAAEQIIRQLPVPPMVHVLRALWKSVVTFAHNAIILPIVALAVFQPLTWSMLALVPALLILLINLSWMATILGIASARFRDLPPILTSVLTIAFYVTPVMWYPELIGNNSLAHSLLGLNPLYHLMQIVRLPMLGKQPTLENWSLTLGMAVVGWLFAAFILKRFKSKIAYWV
jgi:ABC-type polysaccharide/polyol phosphate export permease